MNKLNLTNWISKKNLLTIDFLKLFVSRNITFSINDWFLLLNKFFLTDSYLERKENFTINRSENVLKNPFSINLSPIIYTRISKIHSIFTEAFSIIRMYLLKSARKKEEEKKMKERKTVFVFNSSRYDWKQQFRSH